MNSIEACMKKMLVLGALVIGLAFAGETVALAQCCAAPVAPVCRTPYYGPNYGYYHPHRRYVRQAYVRPVYHNRYGFQPYAPRPRVTFGVNY